MRLIICLFYFSVLFDLQASSTEDQLWMLLSPSIASQFFSKGQVTLPMLDHFRLVAYGKTPVGLLVLREQEGSHQVAELRILRQVGDDKTVVVIHRILTTDLKTPILWKLTWKTSQKVVRSYSDDVDAISPSQFAQFLDFSQQQTDWLIDFLLQNNHVLKESKTLKWGNIDLDIQRWRFIPSSFWMALPWFLVRNGTQVWHDLSLEISEAQKMVDQMMERFLSQGIELTLNQIDQFSLCRKYGYKMPESLSMLRRLGTWYKHHQHFQCLKKLLDNLHFHSQVKKLVPLRIHLPAEKRKSVFLAQVQLKSVSQKLVLQVDKGWGQSTRVPRPYQDYYSLLENHFADIPKLCAQNQGHILVDLLNLFPRVLPFYKQETWVHDPQNGPTGFQQFLYRFFSHPECKKMSLAVQPISRGWIEKKWKDFLDQDLIQKVTFRMINGQVNYLLLYPGQYQLTVYNYETEGRMQLIASRTLEIKQKGLPYPKAPAILDVTFAPYESISVSAHSRDIDLFESTMP